MVKTTKKIRLVRSDAAKNLPLTLTREQIIGAVDPRVRALAVEILDEAVKKDTAQRAERAEKQAAEQASKHKAAVEAEAKKEAKKRKSHKSIVSRLGMIEGPLRAIHDIAELAFAGDDHEAALVVASNLSMLCLKRLEDCLVDLGDYAGGYGEEATATRGLLARRGSPASAGVFFGPTA